MKLYKVFSSFIKNNFARKKKWQNYFQLIHGFASSAMNYGYGSNFENSGEIAALKIIKSKINTACPVLFDAGSNTGRYSLSLSEIFEKNCTVYSFEPAAKTFEKLKENIAGYNYIKPFNMDFPLQSFQ